MYSSSLFVEGLEGDIREMWEMDIGGFFFRCLLAS